jgi:hypothetical protein
MPLINQYILAVISYSHEKYIQLSLEAKGKKSPME